MEKQKNVPALRFPEFSDEWELKKLGDIINIKGRIGYRGYTINDIVKEGEGAIALSPTNINDSGCLKFDKVTYISWFKYEESPEIMLEQGFTVLVKTGSSYGKSALIKDLPEKATINPQLVVLKPTLIESKFLAFLVSNISIQKQIEETIVGGAIPTLSQESVSNFNVIIPSLSEQQKISSFLTAVDEKLQSLKKKKELLEHYKKGVMQQLLSQKIRFKDENGEDYPDWAEKKLGEVAEINPKSKSLPNSFIYIDLESVVDGVLLKEDRIEKENAPSRAQRVLKIGDVLFQMVRPYQKNNLYFDREGEYVASTGYAQIRTWNNSKYIYHYLHLQEFVDKVIERCTGTSYPAINSTDLANIFISLPSLPEQTKIANFLNAIDTKIETVAKQIEQTQAYKKGLLQQLFI